MEGNYKHRERRGSEWKAGGRMTRLWIARLTPNQIQIEPCAHFQSATPTQKAIQAELTADVNRKAKCVEKTNETELKRLWAKKVFSFKYFISEDATRYLIQVLIRASMSFKVITIN